MLVVASVVFTKDIIIRDSTQYCTAKTAGNVQLTVQVKNAARELLLELAVVDLELRGGGVVAQDRRACLARDGRLEVVVEFWILVCADPQVAGEQGRARRTCGCSAAWDAAATAADGGRRRGRRCGMLGGDGHCRWRNGRRR